MKRVSSLKFKVQSSKTSAFTLVELLVVIAVIGILAALLLPALSMAKERAIRVKCLSNVKQITLASLNYAIDNRDRLPVMRFPWPFSIDNAGPWHVGPPDTDFLKANFPNRDILYDPGNPAQNSEYFWNGNGVAINGVLLARVIGYAVTFPGTVGLKPENINTFATPQPFNVGMVMLPAPITSERVLIAGVVISEGGQNKTNAAARASYNYINVPLTDSDGDGGWPGSPLVRSSHVLGKMPTGDNLGMLDGSARWRKFRDMVPRTALPAATTFWW